MRFQSVKDFYHHLKQAYPSHFCRVYLVIIEDDIERNTLIKNIYFFLQKNQVSLKKVSSEESIEEIIQTLQQQFLFSKETAVVIDPLDEFVSKEKLTGYLHHSSGYFLLGARNKKKIMKIYPAIEKYGVILDLHKEKIQDRKNRHWMSLTQLAKKFDFEISSEAYSILLNQFENYETLKNEFLKLITFCSKKKSIEKEDVEILSKSSKEESLWHIAEKMVWDRKKGIPKKELDGNFLHQLIYALRYQLQMGLKCISLNIEELKNVYPYMWPKNLEEKRNIAQKYTKQYFADRLLWVYNIEWMSKNNHTQYESMLIFLLSKF